MNPDVLISVGRIARSRGLAGELVVYPVSDDPERFASLERVVVDTGHQPSESYTILSASVRRRQGRTEVHMRLRGIESREAADALRGAILSVPRNELELAEDEYFLFELAGLRVIAPTGEHLGTVQDVQRMPAQDLLIVTGEDGAEWLIPDVPEFVDKSRLDEGEIVITPVEGLLSVNK